jgi:hypothetical protein
MCGLGRPPRGVSRSGLLVATTGACHCVGRSRRTPYRSHPLSCSCPRHSGRNPLRAPLTPLLAALGALWPSHTATADGVTLLLLGVASLLPQTGRSLAASLLVAYWVAMLLNSSMVYLKMLFGARKGDDCYVSRTPLLNAFRPSPLVLW